MAQGSVRRKKAPSQPQGSGGVAFAYARVSSREQEREGFSIPAQLKLLREYAAQRGLRIVREFVDVQTAKEAGRTNFGEMVALFRKPRPESGVLLVEKTDRLYRNLTDYAIIDDLDLEVHLVKEGAVLSRNSTSSQKLVHDIHVVMARNYVNNLSDEVKKGMREKAAQGLWPTVAPIGYINDRSTRTIKPDPDRAGLIKQVFDWYGSGTMSLKQVGHNAASAGLTHPKAGTRPLTKSEIHRMLRNPLYAGTFIFKGQRYEGKHEPLVSRASFAAVQQVFEAANRPQYMQRHHAFAGLLTCGVCGCSITAETKKGKYIYYHCTRFKGSCDNDYIREERLSELLAELVARVSIPAEVADWIAQALRDSHKEKERFHRTAILRLQGRYNAVQQKIDLAYDDRLSGRISDDFWTRKSSDWERELDGVRADLAQHEGASQQYSETGSRILELAKTAHKSFVSQNSAEQRKLLETLLSNCAYERGTLTPTYRRPFDLLAKGTEMKDWLGRRDSNPNNLLQRRPKTRR
jgi:site-specific DNA recombinase